MEFLLVFVCYAMWKNERFFASPCIGLNAERDKEISGGGNGPSARISRRDCVHAVKETAERGWEVARAAAM